MPNKKGFRRGDGFFLSIAAMATVYFLVSDKMLTSLKFREAIAPSLGPLSRLMPVEFNWGLPVLAVLLLYWAAVWLLDRGRPRRSRGRKGDQNPPERRRNDTGGRGEGSEKNLSRPAHLPRDNPVAK